MKIGVSGALLQGQLLAGEISRSAFLESASPLGTGTSEAAAVGAHGMVPSTFSYSVGIPEEVSYAAEYSARTFPCQRFDAALASGSA